MRVNKRAFLLKKGIFSLIKKIFTKKDIFKILFCLRGVGLRFAPVGAEQTSTGRFAPQTLTNF